MDHFSELDEQGTRRTPSSGVAHAPHPGWEAALAAAAAAVREGELVLVVGGPGTGKSMLLARLSAMLSAEGLRAAHLRHADLGAPPGADILLVDEADRRPAESLAELRAERAACVLAGLPALRDAVRAAGLEPTVIALGPLAADDVGGFVRAVARDGAGRRLTVADEAVAAFAAASQGVPRDLHILAGLAGFDAGLEGGGRIEARHVRVAAAMRHGAEEADDAGAPAVLGDLDAAPAAPSLDPEPAPPAVAFSPARPRGRGVAAAAAALAVAAVAAFAVLLPAHGPAQGPAPEPAPAAAPVAAPEPSPPLAAEQVARTDAAPAPEPAAAPPAAPAMPPLAAPRIVLTYPGNSPAAARGAQEAAAKLARLGWDVDRPQARAPPGPGGGSAAGVTFFFAEDAAFAAAVADALGGGARPAPGSARTAQASPGTIEVALPAGP